MIVVVALDRAEHGRGVSLIDDQDVVEQFATDSADEALGDCVRSRCPNRGSSRLAKLGSPAAPCSRSGSNDTTGEYAGNSVLVPSSGWCRPRVMELVSEST